jgi:hypothetical protein
MYSPLLASTIKVDRIRSHPGLVDGVVCFWDSRVDCGIVLIHLDIFVMLL